MCALTVTQMRLARWHLHNLPDLRYPYTEALVTRLYWCVDLMSRSAEYTHVVERNGVDQKHQGHSCQSGLIIICTIATQYMKVPERISVERIIAYLGFESKKKLFGPIGVCRVYSMVPWYLHYPKNSVLVSWIHLPGYEKSKSTSTPLKFE